MRFDCLSHFLKEIKESALRCTLNICIFNDAHHRLLIKYLHYSFFFKHKYYLNAMLLIQPKIGL